ncbi:branched-chain amino acid ABC transporter permease [Herbaspirillum sp. DW155]|uniref:branched-chain amino acid ABC transporter permease n=1 Tax=Herbaspirillum sp. DW155 TaxID=3095609 RepID=UPI0030849111|nr:branched-chain amino acid ABC transporter permease [Herbaspirillum sp. DW155]
MTAMHASALATMGLDLLYVLSILALTAIGLGIVFGLLGVMNMAHGEFVMLGAYCMVFIQQRGLPTLMALPLAIVVCATAGWAVERYLIRTLYSRPFDTLLATWGLSIVMRELIKAAFGAGYQNVTLAAAQPLQLGTLAYPLYRLELMACVFLGLLALGIWFGRSQVGARIRAMTGNPVLARAVGVNTTRLASLSFVTGVTLAGLCGVMLAPLVRVEPYMGLDYLLNAFFVLIVGGFGSVAGLLAGTGIIGATQSLTANLLDQTAGYAAVLIVSILFLWIRPNGLIARR